MLFGLAVYLLAYYLLYIAYSLLLSGCKYRTIIYCNKRISVFFHFCAQITFWHDTNHINYKSKGRISML